MAAAVAEQRLDIDLAGVLLLKAVIGRDAARVRLRNGPELGIAREELLAVTVAADEAVLDDHGRDVPELAVADDAVIVGELAVGIERTVVRALFDEAAARVDAEPAELRENIRTDGVDDLRAVGIIVAVAGKDQPAVHGLIAAGRVQVQAHEQVGALFGREVHALLHLSQGSIARAVAVRARHVHVDIAVGLELLF